MLDISRDIHSLTDFKKNTSEFVEQLKQTGEPLVLDAAAYQKLLQVAEEARVLEGIRQGIEDMKAGRTISLDEFKEHARTKHGIQA
jgi:PHD/YefM family antitoxin component YafN of YafNO toxin-antitoxin module